MLQYVLKRLLFFIPTLIIISLVTFALSKMAPGDPVKIALGNRDTGESGSANEKIAGEKAYNQMAEELGMHLPNFYFSLTSKAEPDTLYKFLKRTQRENLSRLIDQYGNWPQISDYFYSIKAVEFALFEVKNDSTSYDASRAVKDNVSALYVDYKDKQILDKLQDMKASAKSVSNLAEVKLKIDALEASYLHMKESKTTSLNYIPSIKWYGFNNQYHRWLTNFLKLDFGISYIDKRPVWSKIKDALPWTLLLNFFSIFIAYIIAIPNGVWSARKKGTAVDAISTVVLFILNSLPSFWIATLLIAFFTTEEYGMNFFPTYGLGELTDDMSWLDMFFERGFHLLLPVLCLSYGSLAYLSRQMRGGVLTVLRSDYIRTARAKGLDENTVIWKHAFKNSLIPIITIFAALFPAAISGSFIIENIFSIPGMGKIAFEGLIARDYPMVFTVMMFSAFLTLIGTLIADLLYAFVDPRISFK